MDERYGAPVGAWYANIFRFHVRKLMKEDGFKERTVFADANILGLHLFEKGAHMVSLTVSKESVDRSKVEVHSETTPIREIVLRAVANMVNEVSNDFLKPLLPEDRMEEVKRSLQNTILARG